MESTNEEVRAIRIHKSQVAGYGFDDGMKLIEVVLKDGGKIPIVSPPGNQVSEDSEEYEYHAAVIK